MIDRCRGLEERAAALYRCFAAAARTKPVLCALWTELARDEEEHARTLVRARAHVKPPESWRTRIDGWEEALTDVEERLTAAERVAATATAERQLSAALELEVSELEALRQFLLTISEVPDAAKPQGDHAARLASAAERFASEDSQLRLQAALLGAKARLAGHPA